MCKGALHAKGLLEDRLTEICFFRNIASPCSDHETRFIALSMIVEDLPSGTKLFTQDAGINKEGKTK